MSPFIKYISDEQHYTEVLAKLTSVKRTLWIGTADIKDLYIKQGNDVVPMLGELASLLKKGVEIRLIHAKEPGENFRTDFDRYPILQTSLERVLCPRVHFKILIFDPRKRIHWIGKPNWGRNRHEKPAKKKFRSWDFHKRPRNCRTSYKSVR